MRGDAVSKPGAESCQEPRATPHLVVISFATNPPLCADLYALPAMPAPPAPALIRAALARFGCSHLSAGLPVPTNAHAPAPAAQVAQHGHCVSHGQEPLECISRQHARPWDATLHADQKPTSLCLLQNQ